MKKPPLTPDSIQHKQQMRAMRILCNRISSAFNFKSIKTWKDVYVMQGMSEQDMKNTPHGLCLAAEPSYPEIKAHLEKLQTNLEDRQRLAKPLPANEVETVTTEIAGPPVEGIKDYGFIASPMENFFPYWFQKKAIVELTDGILKHKKHGQVLLASTGSGKTFMALGLLRRLLDVKFADDMTFGAIKYLYVTRSTIVEQTKRVAEKFFNIGIKNAVEILNIERLRSRAGAIWVQEKMEVIAGEEYWTWEWRKMLNPVVIIWDECQALKNEGSTQHKIAAAYNNIKTPTFQVFVSATPFTRIIEAKCFAVSTRHNIQQILGTGQASYLSNDIWPTYASSIAAPASPIDYNEAAIERMTKNLDSYIVRVRGIRPQFDALNSITLISFKTREEQKYYDDTEKRYMEKKAKLAQDIEQGLVENSGIWPLVLMNERCMAAEYCRKEHLAEMMFNKWKDGYAACCAVKYKRTLIAIVQILEEKYGIKRDQITLVWGGGQTQLNKKQKNKAAINAKSDALKAMGMDVDELIDDLDLKDVEERKLEVLPEHLRLGAQSQEERQREIDRFQSGKTEFCLYTFKAGGVGLSLHHTDEFVKVKVKHKESGYAVEEDIPNIPVKPRWNFVTPTYSAIELVQGLGRCPRLTSLSNTHQELVFYRNTVEEDVARIVAQKLRCLSRVVRMREKWEDVIVGGVSADDHIKNTQGMVDDPDDLSGDIEDNEDD